VSLVEWIEHNVVIVLRETLVPTAGGWVSYKAGQTYRRDALECGALVALVPPPQRATLTTAGAQCKALAALAEREWLVLLRCSPLKAAGAEVRSMIRVQRRDIRRAA
jgi:hypothetical protein